MKRPRKAAVLLGLLAVTGLAIWSGCGSLPDGWEDQPGPPRVLVSFPPLYSFVKNVGGDQAGVLCLCTDTGPHDYEFNANDTLKLKRADLFFANGLTLDEKFADKLVSRTSNTKLLYHKLGDLLPATLRKKQAEEDHQHEGGQHAHQHGAYDPHVWLGIPQAISMVERIRDDLKEVDSGHANLYDKNAKDYIDRLKELHKEGKNKLKGLRDVPLITYHESMGYFADSFGLKLVGAIQPAPGHEPAPRELAKLVEACGDLTKHKKQLVLIAVEPQYPKTTAETLRKSLERSGVKPVAIVEVDPLETCAHEDLSAAWYVQLMQKNIDSLAKYAK